MGLDISFDRKKALDAGLMLVQTVNDPEPGEHMADNADYLKWAAEPIECVMVPGCNHMVVNDGVNGIIVRANKWGITYAPLTTWLKANNITWDEF